MKIPLSIALAASLVLCGCSVFHRSPTWDSVVASRSHYSGSVDAKDSYLNRLHQVLQSAGVEHKLVTYSIHIHNVYGEEGIQTATAILYRDETTPRNPWWVMDEYHHVPVWLPSWALDAQLEFFVKAPVDVISVKEFSGSAPQPAVARVKRTPPQTIVHTPREKKFRALFSGVGTRTRTEKPVKAHIARADSDPLTANVLSGQAGASDSKAEAIFRSTHGTQFDPGSSTDRSKMNELRRQLLNRGQRVSLRTQ